MILFSESFVTFLVYGALISTLGGSVALGILLVRDWRAGRVWGRFPDKFAKRHQLSPWCLHYRIPRGSS